MLHGSIISCIVGLVLRNLNFCSWLAFSRNFLIPFGNLSKMFVFSMVSTWNQILSFRTASDTSLSLLWTVFSLTYPQRSDFQALKVLGFLGSPKSVKFWSTICTKILFLLCQTISGCFFSSMVLWASFSLTIWILNFVSNRNYFGEIISLFSQKLGQCCQKHEFFALSEQNH